MTDQKFRKGSPWAIALNRFTRNSIAVTSFLFILFVAMVALLGYIIVPDKTPMSNNQHLEIATQGLGFKVDFFVLPNAEAKGKVPFLKRMLWGQRSSGIEIPISDYWIHEGNLILKEYSELEDSLFVESTFDLETLLFLQHDSSPFQGKANYTEIEILDLIGEKYIITKRFWLGTDKFGRDMLSRLVIGARVSLSVGFIAVAISLVIGITLGATAGYFRGWYDDVIMWLINVVWSIPTLLLVIVLTMVLGKGFWQIFVAVGLTMWVEVARVVRGQVIALREKEFVEAAKVLGFGSWRIIFHHILPNVMGPVMIISAGNFATAILLEAGLSFLGIGVQPPIPSWGTMIKDHYGYIIMEKAYLALIPGLAIMLLVVAFTVIGNGLRDALDTKELD